MQSVKLPGKNDYKITCRICLIVIYNYHYIISKPLIWVQIQRHFLDMVHSFWLLRCLRGLHEGLMCPQGATLCLLSLKAFLFQKADSNGDGYLSADEYYRILKDHGIQCTKEEILQIIQIADKDNDGWVSTSLLAILYSEVLFYIERLLSLLDFSSDTTK